MSRVQCGSVLIGCWEAHQASDLLLLLIDRPQSAAKLVLVLDHLVGKLKKHLGCKARHLCHGLVTLSGVCSQRGSC